VLFVAAPDSEAGQTPPAAEATAGAPAPTGGRVLPAELKIAAPGLTVTGIDSALAVPFTDQLAKAFAPVRIITPRDIAALLGLERQKELLGCGGGECIAELGNALGVQGVLLGDVVKLGEVIQVNARVIDPVAGKVLALGEARVDSESRLLDALTRVGLQLRATFYAALSVPAPPPQVQVELDRGTRRFFPIPLAVGGAALVAGAVLFGLSEGDYQQLTAGPPHTVSSQSGASLASAGQTFQTAGWVTAVAGAAFLVAGVALLLFGSRGDTW
jgi:hypothetical protein